MVQRSIMMLQKGGLYNLDYGAGYFLHCKYSIFYINYYWTY